VIFKTQVVAIDEKGREEVRAIFSLMQTDLKPATLGLTLAEGKTILKGIQHIVIERQSSSCLATYRRCPGCGQTRHNKGYHDLSLRTVFGKLTVKSPRFHHCHCQPRETKTILQPFVNLGSWERIGNF